MQFTLQFTFLSKKNLQIYTYMYNNWNNAHYISHHFPDYFFLKALTDIQQRNTEMSFDL